ncbi:hypothetical protein DER44DRAFT_745937 [Fusarium oxysporum]|nr:hypothetical protein DER44DRAFT_745937 [Fusarium oxysporum]
MEFGSKFDYYWKQNGPIRHATRSLCRRVYDDVCKNGRRLFPHLQQLSVSEKNRGGTQMPKSPFGLPLKMPYFYEYFLVFWARLPSVPTIVYDKLVRSHGHRGYQLPIHNSIPGYMRKQFKETLPNFQKNIATYAAKMLVEDVGLVDLEWSDNLAAPDELAWEHINYHTKSIRARYQFLLDNSVGPVGDCMDMLRLHCFRTMFSSRSNYFNRHEWVAGRDSGGLARASIPPERQESRRMKFSMGSKETSGSQGNILQKGSGGAFELTVAMYGVLSRLVTLYERAFIPM